MRGPVFTSAIAHGVIVALMYFGFINIDQTRPALVQAPQFKADVARVSVGTEKKTVEVPTVNVEL